MEMKFKGLNFELIDGKIVLTDCMGFAKCKHDDQKALYKFVEVQLAGGNHAVHGGAKQYMCSESDLKYIAYSEMSDRLEIVQANSNISVSSIFKAYEDSKVIRGCLSVTNVTNKPITIEQASSIVFWGIGQNGTDSVNNLFLHRFYNSHHIECQPIRLSFHDLGLFNGNQRSFKCIRGINTGSWSTKEELPQAIIEDAESGKFFMFQIESNNSWFWEIGDESKQIYLNLGGPNTTFNQWAKTLKPNETFITPEVAIVTGNSINEVLGEMTKYRRQIVYRSIIDKNLPSIYNEYMHLSWDNPNEERTKKVAPTVAELGIKYYVIDCGWHDECEYNEIYKYVGKWEPSQKRFPSGLTNTIAYIKSLGMKAGLWIEPEIIGYLCQDMIDYYGDDCFMYRNGEKVVQSNRIFLDFRKEKVRNYLSEVIDRMVGYGVSYIKFDYNQDVGAGNERDSDSLGDGLVQNANAYFSWVREMMDKYPRVIFEACASGGQRMDYKTLSIHPLVSTSDQTDYLKYPYIAGNILSAVLPEQAAVWSYPVNALSFTEFDKEGYDEVNARVSESQVIINMVNSLLGRIHLASAVHLLSKEKLALIKEGVEYYNSIVPAKKNGLPYMPWGFTEFYQPKVVSGFVSGKKIYLAVWKLGDDGEFEIPIKEYNVVSAKMVYPIAKAQPIKVENNKISFTLTEDKTARFIEIEIEK